MWELLGVEPAGSKNPRVVRHEALYELTGPPIQCCDFFHRANGIFRAT